MSDLSDRQRQKVGQIECAGRKLSDRVDSLLMMAKLEGGKLVLNPTEVDRHTLGMEIIADFQVLADHQQVQLCSHLPAPGTQLQLDAPLLRRVLDNLIANALKFSQPHSQVTLEILYPCPHHVRINVKDQGRGVSESVRQSIFEKYETGESCQGVVQIGLGLAFCKIAVEAHGGRIFVEPHEPQGSIFTVEI